MEKTTLLTHKRLEALTGILLVTIVMSAGYSYSQIQTLSRQKQELAKKLVQLTESVTHFQKENLSLTQKIQTIESERAAIEQSLESLKMDNEAVRSQLRQIDGDLSSVKEEKSYLEEMLLNKTREIQEIRSQAEASAQSAAASIASTPTDLPEDMAKLMAQKDEDIRKLSDSNKLLAQKLERIYRTTNEKMTEISSAKSNLEETIAQARKLIESEYNTVDLGPIKLEASDKPQGVSAPAKSHASYPSRSASGSKKEGRVLAINEEHGFVVVDLGKNDNIQAGSVLSLKQNGQEVAQLSVLEVRDMMTACNIRDLNQGSKIKINDPVLLLS